MEKIVNWVNRILKIDSTPPTLMPAGMYPYQSPADASPQYRLHLRIEPNGTGLLIINAHTTLHLNHTAAEYAYHLVHDASDATIVSNIKDRYHISEDAAKQDLADFRATILRLAQSEDLDPTTYLGFDRREPYTSDISAPYRLDCALTYRSSAELVPGITPVERVKRELLTSEWSQILTKAWTAGIPQVIFTGGEPTLRPDLPDLISEAEKLGQVTGLLTDGLRLSNVEYFHSLLQAGLDHLMIILDPQDEQSWEAVRDAMIEDIFVTIHLTITNQMHQDPLEILAKLKDMGVKNISISASHPEQKKAVKSAAEYAAHIGLSLVWDLPVPYSSMNPVQFELANEELVDGAGKAWLYVEPDGDVLPAQSINRVMGNLLTDPWETIWAARDQNV